MKNYEVEEFRTLTDEELADVIRNADFWDAELVDELINRAGVFDDTIEEDWEKAAEEDYDIDAEEVLSRAAEALGVEIF